MEVLTVDTKQDWDRDFADVRYQQVRKIRHRLSRKNSNLNMCVSKQGQCSVQQCQESWPTCQECHEFSRHFETFKDFLDENKTKTLIRIGTVKK
jgi:hypothetical protein